MSKRPMLAAKVDFNKLRFPVIASPKLDGIRATVQGGQLLSRTLKRIPNHWTRTYLETDIFEGFDGELILGSPTHPEVYRRSVSFFMSQDKIPKEDAVFFVFDRIDLSGNFWERYQYLSECFQLPLTVLRVEQVILDNLEEVEAYEAAQLSLGYEGIMLRDPRAAYKHGRSTVNEAALLKLKRYQQSEAYIEGVEELLHNENEAFTDEQGLTKRSTHAINKTSSGMLGALLCRTIPGNIPFKIGTGFTEAERISLWREPPIGKIATYAHLSYGVKEKPRHPSFKGLRHPDDL